MTYSIDFRRKVLHVKHRENLSFQETADRFDIGIATVVRWHKRIEALQAGCPRPHRKKINEAALLQDIENYPDAYQYERAKRFGVCTKSIWRVLRKLGVSYKKNIAPSSSKRAGSYYIPRDD
jgi:transposase